MTVLEGSQPDVILIDCMLGGPDGGLRTASLIRERGFSLPILLLAIVGRAAQICAYHEDDMISVGRLDEKPMDPEALSKSVRLLLEWGEEASCFWPQR